MERGRGGARGGRGRGRGRGRGGRPDADVYKALEGAAPRNVQVIEFARARAQELEALTRAISTTSGNKRAFQTLPRHLRRRAMSHNIKRLPVRLRLQAMNEMSAAPPKGSTTLKRHRKNKRRPGYLLRDYERRQKTFVWLETHIWHAKRFKMVNLWGYKIALHPSDRSVKACYRASAHLCAIHDASYFACIELSGQEQDILNLLRTMVDPADPFLISSRPYLHGKRAGKLMVHHPMTFPMGAIAPIDLLWRPVDGVSDAHTSRQLWVWVHPSASAELLQAFNQISTAHKVTVTSLKDELVRFELTGPHSHTILTSVLRLALSESKGTEAEENASVKIWRALAQLRTPASLPSGAVLAVNVDDPRVTFPPLSINKTMRARDQAKPSPTELAQEDFRIKQALVGEWPTGAIQSLLWDKATRERLRKGFYSDAELVKRKKAQLVFPTPSDSVGADVMAQDDAVQFARVPMLLVQRPPGLKRGYGAGWDVILPARWAMPFWKSFIYAGARSIGLREHRKQASEQAQPHFPEDYPDSNAYHDYIQDHSQELMETFFKKPPAKRPNYDKLAVESPFFPDFYSLLGLPIPDELTGEDEESDEEQGDDKTENTEEKGKDKMPLDAEEEPDHLSDEMETTDTPSEEKEATNSKEIDRSSDDQHVFAPRPFFVARSRHVYNSASNISPSSGILTALSCISLRMVDRGVPHYNALICLPTDNDLELYRSRSQLSRKHHHAPVSHLHEEQIDESLADDEKGPIASLHDDGEREVVGFVTTGEYSYIRGRGSALGFVASAKLLASSATRPPVVLIRNASSPFFFPARYSYI